MNQEQKEFSRRYLQYGNKLVEYTIIKSKRRKTSEIIVDKDKITIRAPLDKSLEEIEGVLRDKIRWVVRKQKELLNEKQDIIKPTYENESTLPFLGINYTLNVIVNNDKFSNQLVFENNGFIAYLKDDIGNQKETIKTLYIDWLNFHANKIFNEKMNKYSNVVNVRPEKIVIKNLVNRWGSLSRGKTINLNVHLIKAPETIIDYIIVHELCHLNIRGHSHKFWSYLKQFIPDYQQKISWLKRNSHNLL
ncbi:MAG: M48 family metallopeptidase [Candidatus Nitrosocosmicus sp.]